MTRSSCDAQAIWRAILMTPKKYDTQSWSHKILGVINDARGGNRIPALYTPWTSSDSVRIFAADQKNVKPER